MRRSLPFEVRFNELFGVQLEGDERAAAAAPPYFIIRPSAFATPSRLSCSKLSRCRMWPVFFRPGAAGVPFDGHQERFSGYSAASVPFKGHQAHSSALSDEQDFLA